MLTQAIIAARPDAKTDDIRQTIKKTSLITAVKTPYLENGKIDMRAYDNLINIQIQHGAGGVIVGGTTGKRSDLTTRALQFSLTVQVFSLLNAHVVFNYATEPF